MMLKAIFLFIVFWLAGTAVCQTATNEPFDRIVLKDMTVIKASLVKEVGDSLAYFELNDPDFIKHMVGRDQVFKWVKYAPETAAPPQTTAQNPTPPPLPLKKEIEAINDTLPIVDYQVIKARYDSIEQSKNKSPAASVALVQQPAINPAPASIIELDTSETVPENLTKVRLDPPTGTEGVKVLPRSGMFALNINPSLTSLGAGLRGWSAAGFGFSAKAAVLWGSASGFLVNGEIMQALNKQGRVRWYGLLSIGYTWETITTEAIDMYTVHIPSTSMDLSFLNYCFGLGAEWRTGINRNHGWALEIAYQGGSAEYETEGYTIDYGYGFSTEVPPQKQTVELLPVYFGLTYAYYF